MAIVLEKVVEKFYQGLDEGKFLGRKCPKCGAVEFPPVYACNTCGNLETEWVEISGKAKVKSIVMPAALSSKPEYAVFGKYAYGEIEIEEGACFNGVIVGMTKKKRKEAVLPLPCHAETVDRDGYKTVVFVLD
ncbi:MAG: hypothetical protein HUJ72_00100 [Blautia sp.]|nr:hypothetical protein [Blautia sp.]